MSLFPLRPLRRGSVFSVFAFLYYFFMKFVE